MADRPPEFLEVILRKYSIAPSGDRLWSNKYNRLLKGWVCKSKLGQSQYRCHKVLCGNREISIKEHQIIWFLTYGEWPSKEIDHADQDGLNNFPGNLILSEHRANGRNLPMNRKNTSGVNGVIWIAAFNRWIAQATLRTEGKRKNIYLGCYSTIFDAACARKSYDNKNGFSGRHGLCMRPGLQEQPA